MKRARILLLPALLPALLATGAATARAQGSAVVDEGTFSVSRKGAPQGRESFRVIRAPGPGGQAYLATGTSVLGDTKVTSRLGADAAGLPIAYDAELSQQGEVVQRLQGKFRPGRFSVLASTRTGESAREYVLSNGALLLDDQLFHHFFFVPLAAQLAQVIVIEPRTAQQSRHQLQQRGREDVEIAGRMIAARRYSLVGASGSRDVWVDEKGRLLKVVSGEDLVALRDDPPR